MIKVYRGGKLECILIKRDFTEVPIVRTSLNKESTISFSVDRDSEKAKYLTSDSKLEADGKFYTLRGEGAIERDFKEYREIKIRANERYKDLEDVFPFPFISNDPNTKKPADFATIIVGGGTDLSGGRFEVGTAGHALFAVLNKTGWNVGEVDVSGIRDLEVEKKSVLGLIQEIQNIWGGYLVFDSREKLVSLRDENKWRNYSGFTINENKYALVTKNIVGKVYNRVFPFGKDWLDIAKVNGGQKFIDTASPFLSEIHTTTVVNNGIAEQDELLKWGREQGKLLARERYNYTADIVDLRYLEGYESEKFELGDIINIHPKGDDVAKVRVLSVERELMLPFKVKLELGEPMDRLEDVLKASIDQTRENSIVINGGKIDGRFILNSSIIADKIDDAALEASKFNLKQIILTGEIWTDDKANKAVSWNSHKLYYNGKTYNIPSGRTTRKYVVWRHGANKYETLTENEFQNNPLGDNDFVVLVNNDGVHDVAWFSRPARQFIGSTFIADAAINDAKIAWLSAVKITTGLLKSANGDTWIDMDTGDFSFKNGKLRWDSEKSELVIGDFDSMLGDIKTEINDVKNDFGVKLGDLKTSTDNAIKDMETTTTSLIEGVKEENKTAIDGVREENKQAIDDVLKSFNDLEGKSAEIDGKIVDLNQLIEAVKTSGASDLASLKEALEGQIKTVDGKILSQAEIEKLFGELFGKEKEDIQKSITESEGALRAEYEKIASKLGTDIQGLEAKINESAKNMVEIAKKNNKVWWVIKKSELLPNGVKGKIWADITPDKPNISDHYGDFAVVEEGTATDTYQTGTVESYRNVYVYVRRSGGKGAWLPFAESAFVLEDKDYNGVKISTAKGIQIFASNGVLSSELNKDHLRFYGVGSGLDESYTSSTPFTNVSNDGLQFVGAYGTGRYPKDAYYYYFDAEKSIPAEDIRKNTFKDIFEIQDRMTVPIALPERFKNYNADNIKAFLTISSMYADIFDARNSPYTHENYDDVKLISYLPANLVISANVDRITNTAVYAYAFSCRDESTYTVEERPRRPEISDIFVRDNGINKFYRVDLVSFLLSVLVF